MRKNEEFSMRKTFTFKRGNAHETAADVSPDTLADSPQENHDEGESLETGK